MESLCTDLPNDSFPTHCFSNTWITKKKPTDSVLITQLSLKNASYRVFEAAGPNCSAIHRQAADNFGRTAARQVNTSQPERFRSPSTAPFRSCPKAQNPTGQTVCCLAATAPPHFPEQFEQYFNPATYRPTCPKYKTRQRLTVVSEYCIPAALPLQTRLIPSRAAFVYRRPAYSATSRSASCGIPTAARSRTWVNGLRIMAVSGEPGSTRNTGTSGRT